ncbi:endo alpha-1,4 polygalactosaminidase [Catellatospora paridis]|uniref:endo alpha-1,4 polygalactosaminidase n=1 Tax=Catellatospora paridis TaxID=1617086 RepID=UPI001E5BB7F6|nr:endo alpha-1,4 polygalactosaminidase [Catellatospora paridis]
MNARRALLPVAIGLTLAGGIWLAVTAIAQVPTSSPDQSRAAQAPTGPATDPAAPAPTPPSSAPTGSTSADPAAPGLPPGAAPAGGRWQPRVGASWQWQLSGKIDLTVAADVYDLDAFTTTAAQVADLHRAGRKVICYVNAGAYEEFRPDRGRYPAEVLGRDLSGWPGERWVDIRRWDLLEPILTARFTMCRDKGFDGVEPDNVDAYANDSGFPLRAADQLEFNGRVAKLARGLGLAVGLKNDVEQAADLVGVMDFAVNEECAKYRECSALGVFIAAGKPVFHVEYELPPAAFCPVTKPLGFSSIGKPLELGAQRTACP